MTIKNRLKDLIKQCMYIVAAAFGPHKRITEEPKLLILMYHRVLPDYDERIKLEEPGMYVTPETFRNNLETLTDYFDFVKLTDWLNKKNNNEELPKMACAITFDDGWLDNFEYAYPILLELEIPATIFVVSDMIGTYKEFWPERLGQTVYVISKFYSNLWDSGILTWLREAKTSFDFSNKPPTNMEVSELITYAKKYTDDQLHTFLDIAQHEISQHVISQEVKTDKPALMGWNQIIEMTNSGIIEIGSHTCNHTRLNSNTPFSVIKNEVVNSKLQIEENVRRKVDLFCYPNGDFTNEVADLVNTNYIGAVTTKSGWNNCHTDVRKLNRIGVHEDVANTKMKFISRISGWY